MEIGMAEQRYAVVEDGVVANVVVWDADDQPGWAPQIGAAVPCPPEVGCGWTSDGSNFHPPAPSADEPAAAGADIRVQRTDRP
jgi:hypothetical protein